MAERKPRLVWVNTKESSYEKGRFDPIIDELLHIPGNSGKLHWGLQLVLGNELRGRNRNSDTINIRYVDEYDGVVNLQSNLSLNWTPSTLAGEVCYMDGFIWKGPVVAVLLNGNKWDPKLVRDFDLTTYRDVIDYLGLFRNGGGSLIGDMESHFSERILAERAGKVKGVRINCLGDQGGDPSHQFEQVNVPKMHPLFSYEGDDSLDIPSWLDINWQMKSYGKKTAADTEQDAAKNHMAELLLLQACGSDPESPWEQVSQYRLKHIGGPGSVLLVDSSKQDLDIDLVRAICEMIQQVVVPLIAENNQGSEDDNERVLEAITSERLEEFLQYEL